MQMHIHKHHIRNIDAYLSRYAEGALFRAVATLPEPSDPALRRAGFPLPAEASVTILPKIIGPFSRFNAQGKWIVRRDLPKESRYIRTVQWKWEQWEGRARTEHEDFKDIYRHCYPREFSPPPALELTLLPLDGQWCVASPELRKAHETADLNRHCINLMLELFTCCELVTSELRRITMPVLRRANWRLLPPGEYPWERLEAHIDAAVGNRSESTRSVIWDRQQTIKSFGPDEIYVGEAGFQDYLAYVFRRQQLVILESIRKDNAIYAFGMNWTRVSQLSKAEILRNSLQTARIVHTKGWKGALARLMARSSAA
jgi:hypothetical protein